MANNFLIFLNVIFMMSMGTEMAAVSPILLLETEDNINVEYIVNNLHDNGLNISVQSVYDIMNLKRFGKL